MFFNTKRKLDQKIRPLYHLQITVSPKTYCLHIRLQIERASLANNTYTTNSSYTDIPAGIMTYGNIRLTNVDVEASEFSNITLWSDQDGELVFTNVKIRK